MSVRSKFMRVRSLRNLCSRAHAHSLATYFALCGSKIMTLISEKSKLFVLRDTSVVEKEGFQSIEDFGVRSDSNAAGDSQNAADPKNADCYSSGGMRQKRL